MPTDLYTEAADIPYAANDQGGFLYYLSRGLTFWHPSADSDVAICQLASMLPSHPIEQTLSENRPVSEDGSVKGSLELLWPLYKTISLSLFLSTFSHALTGRSSGGASPLPSTSSDTGLTLFEDSLVFAEAEAVVDPRTGNVSPEVLYIALVSSFAHLTAQIVGLVAGTGAGGTNGSRGSLAKYRLVTTGIWGVAFLGGFAWALWKGGGRVLGFPTGTIP